MCMALNSCKESSRSSDWLILENKRKIHINKQCMIYNDEEVTWFEIFLALW